MIVKWKDHLKNCTEFAQNSRKWCVECSIFLAQNSDDPSYRQFPYPKYTTIVLEVK